ncbi:hypothetical protein [Thermoactinomyces sp. DSM 45892]|uniref:hypothetical protein n=1 Tax=Thermoactinomyces sp. DSM 45892 TaxID=1882753 RepID=UPI00089B1319|nr:hypothetical protein [Thermoactinomyces sp. DSM 45892]SDY86873.1 hypothetical protein SAMN05444416_109121 [Thermoactinomyces sp. DSM 45892]
MLRELLALLSKNKEDVDFLNLIDYVSKLDASLQNELLAYIQKASEEEVLRKIVKELCLIEPDPNVPTRTRQDTLERILRFVTIARKHDEVRFSPKHKKNIYVPTIRTGELVVIQFAGLGSELDDIHYGVVWDVKHALDQVSILPTTSFKPNSTKENGLTFNIGQVGFLREETVVKLQDATSVTRKKILSNRHLDPHDPEGKLKNVRLNNQQMERIQDGLRVKDFKENTLFQEILTHRQDCLPIFDDHSVQYTHLNRPFIIHSSSHDQLRYTLHNQPNEIYTLYRKKTMLSRSERKKLLYEWANATGRTKDERIRNQEIAYTKIQVAASQD